MPVSNINQRVLARRDPEALHLWVAQAIEGDLVGQGATLEAALEDLRAATISFLTVARAEAEHGFRGHRQRAPPEAVVLFEDVLATGRPVLTTPQFFAEAEAGVSALITFLHVFCPADPVRVALLPWAFAREHRVAAVC